MHTFNCNQNCLSISRPQITGCALLPIKSIVWPYNQIINCSVQTIWRNFCFNWFDELTMFHTISIHSLTGHNCSEED